MSSEKYIHAKVENKIYSYWEKKQLFKPKKNKKKYSIVIPPPLSLIHISEPTRPY